MDKRLIIIIGLPGSGKTTFSKQLKDYVIFDDFISDFYNGDVLLLLQSNKKICLIDPRLCIYDIFLKYISILEQYIKREQIQLILFENNPEQCLINISNRSYPTVTNKTINEYSKKYSILNYIQWNSYTIPVYTN